MFAAFYIYIITYPAVFVQNSIIYETSFANSDDWYFVFNVMLNIFYILIKIITHYIRILNHRLFSYSRSVSNDRFSNFFSPNNTTFRNYGFFDHRFMKL